MSFNKDEAWTAQGKTASTAHLAAKIITKTVMKEASFACYEMGV